MFVKINVVFVCIFFLFFFVCLGCVFVLGSVKDVKILVEVDKIFCDY